METHALNQLRQSCCYENMQKIYLSITFDRKGGACQERLSGESDI